LPPFPTLVARSIDHRRSSRRGEAVALLDVTYCAGKRALELLGFDGEADPMRRSG